MPVGVDYNSSSTLNSSGVISMNITSRLTNFVAGQYIESILSVALPWDASLNQTLLECFSADLGGNAIVMVTDSSGNYNCCATLL